MVAGRTKATFKPIGWFPLTVGGAPTFTEIKLDRMMACARKEIGQDMAALRASIKIEYANVDFGGSYYNHHYFYYGYHIQVAAIIGFLDHKLDSGSWLVANMDWVKGCKCSLFCIERISQPNNILY
jgi:hypothetical protein